MWAQTHLFLSLRKCYKDKHEHAILVLIALTIILVNVPLKAEYQALHKSLHDEWLKET